jgi:glutaminyl-tRNA synthetase
LKFTARLYNWFIDQLQEGDYRPRQVEFARLNLTYTVMSKRRLLELVKEGYVNGWDDPRMPTISGLRRRGYTPESIRSFSDRIGVTKVDGMIDVSLLEYSVRDHLNKTAQRVMGVLNPLKVVITNYPKDRKKNTMPLTIRKTRKWVHARLLSHANFILNGMILWKTLPEILPPGSRS